MFEKYTEKARRVIFFARYEASQFGSPTIEAEHLLLGLIREDKNLTTRYFPKTQSRKYAKRLRDARWLEKKYPLQWIFLFPRKANAY